MKTLSQIKSEVKSGKITKASALNMLYTMKSNEAYMSRLRQRVINQVACGEITQDKAVEIVEKNAKCLSYSISNYK